VTNSRPRLTVAALCGGCGKTTISLGMTAAWRRRGRRIIPFKKGPDYIDAGWLAQAAGHSCYNLDPYMMDRERVCSSFLFRTASDTDAAIIEGNRGLYDGADAEGTYSTAELAKMLASPVVLIVDCTKVTRTLAAMVYGCRLFDPSVNLAGVILNRVATGRQERLVRRTIEDATDLPVLGAVPRIRHHELPERHLGLVPHQEHPMVEQALRMLADLAEQHLDLDRLWHLALSAPIISPHKEDLWSSPASPVAGVRIGVIRDSVFQFYYPENIEILERLGAEILVFSALEADKLPEVDALYLGGGFPETHAEVLANNEGLRTDIRRAAEHGLPVYAECGGLMYLGRELVLDNCTYPMAGVFPVSFCLEKRPQGHGYTEIRSRKDNTYFRAGEAFVGHEFHYSRPLAYDASSLELVFDVERGHGFDNGRDGLLKGHVLASYTHLHALGTTRWAESLFRLAVQKAA
jgi:cobyrinic acid a,c-diamide synthase